MSSSVFHINGEIELKQALINIVISAIYGSLHREVGGGEEAAIMETQKCSKHLIMFDELMMFPRGIDACDIMAEKAEI